MSGSGSQSRRKRRAPLGALGLGKQRTSVSSSDDEHKANGVLFQFLCERSKTAGRSLCETDKVGLQSMLSTRKIRNYARLHVDALATPPRIAVTTAFSICCSRDR